MSDQDVSRSEQLTSLKRAAMYRPAFTVFIIVFSAFAALLEGVGLTFLLPIIEVAQAGADGVADADGVVGVFLRIYTMFGLPFTSSTSSLVLGP